MAIDAKHKQYQKFAGKWKKIDDIVNNDDVDDYLIPLNPLDQSEENKKRNERYKERAVFYAITGQTVQGLVGTAFKKDPNVDLPDGLKYLVSNIDGRGNSIQQQSRSAVKCNVTKSRGALFTSFPKTDGPISKQDVVNQKYVATISLIKPERIINWREQTFGAQIKLTLVVFEDVEEILEDYVLKEKKILRELYIDLADGNYKERHWHKQKDSDVWVEFDNYMPRDSAGNPFKEIPFQFFGGINNDPSVDAPIMEAMVDLNIAHYRNSADYEDSVYFCGQVQPWMSGVDQPFIDMLKENNMYVGSRMLLAVPSGEQFGFEAAPENPMVKGAMADKVDMMISMGARMIMPGGVAKTAEQSANEKDIQHSPLSLSATNVSAAYMKAIAWAGKFMGADTANAMYELNTDFALVEATPAELKEVVAGFVAGTIPGNDYVNYMKEYGIFDEEKKNEEYLNELGAAQ